MLGSIVAAEALAPAGPSMTWNTVDGGGGKSTALVIEGVYELTGTIGQLDAFEGGPMTGGAFTFSTGYWNDHQLSPIVPCPADITGDGFINTDDLLVVVSTWGTNGAGDVDDNGTVDSDDLLIVIAAWGTCPTS
jgi:hypothetical protein